MTSNWFFEIYEFVGSPISAEASLRAFVALHPVAIAAYDKYASSHPPTNFGGRRLELELFTLPSEF
jgi:hypothetical protein